MHTEQACSESMARPNRNRGQRLGGPGSRQRTLSENRSTRAFIVGVSHKAAEYSERKTAPLASHGMALPAVFRNDGDYWTIAYRDTFRQLDDMKGFHYIVHLLRREGEGCRAIDLVAATDRRGDERREGIIDPVSDGLSVVTDLGDAGAILDERAAGEYRGALDEIKQRLTLLNERLEEAERCNDLGACEAARLEIEDVRKSRHWLRHELAGAGMGRNGKRRYPRKAASHVERARLRVTKGIKTALNKLHKAGLVALADHLRKQIKRGYECVYTANSEHPIEWMIDRNLPLRDMER